MKLDVSDFSSDAVFVVFDGDMQNLLDIPCRTLVSLSKVYGYSLTKRLGLYIFIVCFLKLFPRDFFILCFFIELKG